jgi:hypothetical protein
MSSISMCPPRFDSSIGGYANAANGLVGYAVPTANSGGSELLIFVR